MTTTPTHPISDRAVSWLRTVVPVLWGSVVAAILRAITPHLPGDLGTALADWLGSETTLALVTATAIAAWYALWRWAEPRIPDWLTRVVLGSAQTPVYVRDAEIGILEEYAPPTSGTPPPSAGRVVRYTSPVGDGVTSPALVLHTRPAPDLTVDLLVHALGGDFREYNVPHGDSPGAWSWPSHT